MNIVRRIFLLVFALLLFVVASIVLLVGIAFFDLQSKRDDWKQRTSPLPAQTVQLLCKNFNLHADHPLCTGQKDVYGPDFYDVIRSSFRPSEEYRLSSDVPATFEEVERKIGAFQVECEPATFVAAWNREYFVCDYDLRGDGQFMIGVFYYSPEMTVFRIATPMGDD